MEFACRIWGLDELATGCEKEATKVEEAFTEFTALRRI